MATGAIVNPVTARKAASQREENEKMGHRTYVMQGNARMYAHHAIVQALLDRPAGEETGSRLRKRVFAQLEENGDTNVPMLSGEQLQRVETRIAKAIALNKYDCICSCGKPDYKDFFRLTTWRREDIRSRHEEDLQRRYPTAECAGCGIIYHYGCLAKLHAQSHRDAAPGTWRCPHCVEDTNRPFLLPGQVVGGNPDGPFPSSNG